MSTVRMVIPEAELAKLQFQMQQWSSIHQSQVLLNGMRAAGRVVRNRAKELAPVARTEGYKRGEVTIKKTQKKVEKASVRTTQAYAVKAFVRENEPVIEVRVKAAERAPHFHLVELGHDIVTGGTKERTGRKTGTSRRTGEKGKGSVTGRVEGTQFLSRGGKYSEAQQIAELNKAALKAIQKLIGG